MMDIRQFGVQLGEYLYDCGVNIDQVKEITKIVEQIRQCAYEQGILLCGCRRRIPAVHNPHE